MPLWKACFDGGFKPEVAFKMLNGKGPELDRRHNVFHSASSTTSATAGHLIIPGRLQSHKMTAASIAVAFDMMSAASEAALVCEGVQLLRGHEHDISGVAAAKWFLREHPKPTAAGNGERPSSIPGCFWDGAGGHGNGRGWSPKQISAMPKPRCGIRDQFSTGLRNPGF